jgi:hypothetical protein
LTEVDRILMDESEVDRILMDESEVDRILMDESMRLDRPGALYLACFVLALVAFLLIHSRDQLWALWVWLWT